MPRHASRHWTFAAVASAIAATGCTPEIHRYVRFPDLFHPGPAPYQRAAAVEHDPYPLDDAGPPVVGGRPLGYQAGVPEVERARLAAPPPPNLRPIGVPTLPTVPPPIVVPNAAAPAYPAAPPPIVTTPYPAAPTAPAAPFVQQQRSPY